MSSESVRVVVRSRPLNDREKAVSSGVVLSMDLQHCQCFIWKPGAEDEPPKQFTFDGTYSGEHATEQLYNEAVCPLVEGVTEGYNGTIFAYGQTGSGKSFTMQGVSEPEAQRGVIPRAFEHIFESIQCAENTKFLVRACYLEIYNEDVRDLLGNDVKQRLELKEHPERGVHVRDLSMHSVHSVGECERIMERGCRNRAVGSTLMNKDSSRSHSIFTLHLEICRTDSSGRDHLRAGKLNLVDLAGSERQSKTGATGERLREATKINLSLSALGNVISALVDGRSKFIPYRDSKLTRLLQDSLGGNTRTLMIACLSPAGSNYEESLSTLRYANRAKSIQNRPRINEDPKEALIRGYQEEIRKLRALLQLDTGDPSSLLAAESPAFPSRPPSTSEAAKEEKIKEEFQRKIAKLQAEFSAEQESKAKLQEDLASLRLSYESELWSLKAQARRGSSTSSKLDAEKVTKATAASDQVKEQKVWKTDLTSKVSTVAPLDQKNALLRLQQLEQEVVGGEQARNQELQQKRRQRKKLADQRKVQLIHALSEDSEDSNSVMLKVYDSIQEELYAKSQLLIKVQGKLKMAKLEIRDLQVEFEEERNDLLATIRKLEREAQLTKGLLERMAPLVRRDCNYSNLDRLKKEAIWDEESAAWRLPEVVVQKTELPSVNASAQRGSAAEAADAPPVEEEDRFKEMLDRSESETLAWNYFKPRRASLLLGGDAAKGHAPLSVTPPVSSDPALPRPFRLEALTTAASTSKGKRKKGKPHIHVEGN
ncbi:kinesin-like protein KIF17 isoform X2 [Oryzias melastigma]|uniref:kinesin-like protein KIF17 isoform X2 n=1 Tax=Oryzias melastigma TaxID=30732 RepID=UPI000CF8102C|nr:kinesin-like protein KIF17 isoform X2 [Oryzias melastigma]